MKVSNLFGGVLHGAFIDMRFYQCRSGENIMHDYCGLNGSSAYRHSDISAFRSYFDLYSDPEHLLDCWHCGEYLKIKARISAHR